MGKTLNQVRVEQALVKRKAENWDHPALGYYVVQDGAIVGEVVYAKIGWQAFWGKRQVDEQNMLRHDGDLSRMVYASKDAACSRVLDMHDDPEALVVYWGARARPCRLPWAA